MYEGIQSEILSTARSDENSDLSTTYLGRLDMTKNRKLKQKKHSQYQNKDTQWENC